MFRFYIRNYLENGEVKPKETLMYEIPETIQDQLLEGLQYKGEMGKSETFEFSLPKESPWYKKIRQHLTIIRIVYDQETIFFGRVIDFSKDFDGKRAYHCEGALGFLLDSYQSPSKEAKRKQVSVLSWMQTMIKQHNDQVGENSWKYLTLGEVPGQYTSATKGQQVENVPDKKYGTDSWQETMSCFEELVSDNGGYLRIRYENQNGNEILYLDWLKDYFRDWNSSMTPIEVGVNLIEENTKVDISNLFTVLIPYGSKSGSDFHINHLCWPNTNHPNVEYIKVPELITEDVYTEEELTNPYYSGSIFRSAIDDYGIIYKVQKFENARNPVELFTFAKDWIKNNYRASVISMTIKALDLHLIGEAVNQYKVGDQIKLKYRDSESGAIKERMLCIMAIQYDFQNPENNSYTLGIPDNPYNKKYGTKQKSGGGGGGGGITPPPDDNGAAEREKTAKLLEENINGWWRDNREQAGLDPFDIETGSLGETDVPVGKMLKEFMPGTKIRLADIDPIGQEQIDTGHMIHRTATDVFKCSSAQITRLDVSDMTGTFAGIRYNGEKSTVTDLNGNTYTVTPTVTTDEDTGVMEFKYVVTPDE